MGRQLCRRTEAPQGETLAPRNGDTWLCRQWGANLAGVRLRSRAKCWRLTTEAQGFAGNGAPTRPVTGRASGQNVGASQRRHKALPAMGRQLCRRTEAPQSEMLAPRNGYTWLCRQWGANSGDRQRRLRAKCWRLVTEIHGFAGNGAPTRALGPARTWCTSPRKTLFFRFLCTKSSSLFSARPARTWCTNPRKTLFFRSLCTKSPDLFSARPAPTWCTNPRKTLFFRSLCTKSPDLFSARPARTWCTNPRKTLFFRPLYTKSPGLFSNRPARTWCTNPRKASFLRSICTKSPGLFSARPAMGRQLVRLPTTGRHSVESFRPAL